MTDPQNAKASPVVYPDGSITLSIYAPHAREVLVDSDFDLAAIFRGSLQNW